MKFPTALGFRCAALIGIVLTVLPLTWAATPPANENPSRLWIRLQDGQGNPTTARIYLRAENGEYYIPPGSIGRGRRERFFHARGQFQIVLPAGKYAVEAVKGF